MAEDGQLLISFTDVDVATANRLAADLEDSLLRSVPGATIDRRREDPLNQDFGATLVLVLGSAAATAIAKGVAAWLAKRHETSIHLTHKRADGELIEVTIEGPATRNAEPVIRTFLAGQQADT